MNVFEAVKQSVTTRQAAEHFGIRVGRNGMCVCPFHADKNPSMKVDRRFHCFGCQADGDVIDFVSRPATGSPGRNPRNSGSAVWSVTASGCYATIETCCAAGNRTMPPRRQTRIPTRCLWKPYKSRTMWTICWMCCSLRTWRNGQPLSSTVERK